MEPFADGGRNTRTAAARTSSSGGMPERRLRSAHKRDVRLDLLADVGTTPLAEQASEGGAVDPYVETACGQPRGGVVREQDRSRMLDGNA